MRREIHFSRRVEHVELFVRFYRLQGGSAAGIDVPVIDEQRGAALHVYPASDGLDQGCCSGAGFDHSPRGCCALGFRDSVVHRIGSGHEGELSPFDADHPFAPPLFGHYQLPDGQGVQEFVRQQKNGATIRDAIDCIVKLGSRQHTALHFAQGLGTLDQMHVRAQPLTGHGTQRILG